MLDFAIKQILGSNTQKFKLYFLQENDVNIEFLKQNNWSDSSMILL